MTALVTQGLVTQGLVTLGLGRRYGRIWALRDCHLAVPAGHVAALVGPNGAGKTTLLHLAVGLARPTAGQVRVLDGLTPGSPAALAGTGFVAQDAPLYQHLTVAATLDLARSLNQRWDSAQVTHRLGRLGIPLGHRVGALSGGQQAPAGPGPRAGQGAAAAAPGRAAGRARCLDQKRPAQVPAPRAAGVQRRQHPGSGGAIPGSHSCCGYP